MSEFKPESYEACKGCSLLPKGERKPRFVPTERGEKAPEGTVDAVFIGEAPGEDEDKQRRPFVGVSGDKLRKAIHRTVETTSYAFTNVVRCRPTDEQGKNRAPTEAEIAHCRPYLIEDLKALNPRLVVMLGSVSLGAVAPPGLFAKEGEKASVMKTHGQIREAKKGGRRYLPVFHPSYVLRNFKDEPAWEKDLAKVQVGLATSEADTPFMNKGKSEHLDTIDKVKAYLRFLRKEWAGPVALDLEAENLNRVAQNRILSVQLSHDIGEGKVILLDHKKSSWSPEEREEIGKELRKTLRKAEKVKVWVTHNGKFDYDKLRTLLKANRWSAPIVDTMFMAHLLDDNRAGDNETKGGSIGYKLKSLAREWLNYHHYDESTLDSRNQGGLALEALPLKDFVKYGGEDAYVTLRLFNYILQQAEKEHYRSKLLRMAVYWGARMLEMIPTMERWGFQIDKKQLALLSSKDSPVRKRVAELEREIQNMEVVRKANEKLCATDGRSSGMEGLFGQKTWLFDLQKKGHLETVCFNVLKLKPVAFGKPTDKWPKGAPAIDKGFFAEYAPDKGQEEGRETVPFVAALKEYRGLAKLESSYVQSIRSYLFDEQYNADNKHDCRIRSSFWITRTVTGRWSSSDTNLQQAPRCLRRDTLVHTAGGIRRLGDIVGKKLSDAPSGAKEVRDWHKYEAKETYKLVTERGYEMEGTPNHRVPVLTASFEIEDRELQDLRVGDTMLLSLGGKLPSKLVKLPKLAPVDNKCRLCGKISKTSGFGKHLSHAHGLYSEEYTRRTGHLMRSDIASMPKKIPEVMTEDLARLTGVLLTEGYLVRDALEVWNTDLAVLEDFSSLWYKAFGQKPSIDVAYEAHGVRQKTYVLKTPQSRVLRHWFSEWGLTRSKSKDKRVPEVILCSPRPVLLSFLAGFIAGDGYIRKDYITMCSTSKKMLREIQAILSALGYPSSFSVLAQAHGNSNSSYELKVHGEDARILEKELPFVRQLHQTNSDVRYAGLRRRDVPFLKSWLRTHWPRVKPCVYNVNGKNVRVAYPGPVGASPAEVHTTPALVRDHQAFLEALRANDKKRYELLQRFIQNEVVAVKVVSLRKKEHKKPVKVYDLTTDTHYYNANGLVTHNSDNDAKAAIKSLFRAAPGYILMEADYGQAEIRWWAHISGDKAFIQAFRRMAAIEAMALENPNDEELQKRVKNECDIHRQVAASMFGIPINDVTKEQRQAAKSLAFGSIYGQHYKTLAKILKKTPEEAQEIQRKFLSQFPNAGSWLTAIEKEAQAKGYVESPMGRRRRLQALYASDDQGMIQAANRRARNSPIQAQSSDTTGLAGWLMVRYIQEHNKDWKVINVVHDAITLELPLIWSEIEEASRVLHEIMTKTVLETLEKDFGVKVEVPFSVDYKLGLKWGHMGKEARGEKLRKEYKRFKKEHAEEVKSGWVMQQAA